MPRKHGEYESVKVAILDVAMQLFTEVGVHATSLGDIAGRAELSKGTLYYYYQAKDQLIEDIAQLHTAKITDILYAWIDTLDRDSQPIFAIEDLLDRLKTDPRMIRLHVALAAEAALGNEILQRKFAEKYREWTVLAALKIPTPLSENLRAYTHLLITLADGYALQSSMGVCDLTRETIFQLI